MKTLNEIGKEQRGVNVANGFDVISPADFTDDKYKVPAELAMIGSEVGEAVEGFRYQDQENFSEELADIILRTLQLASGLEIDIDKAVADKLEANKARKNRHGGKRI